MRKSMYHMLALFVVSILSIIARGFVFRVLWGWFLVPWLTPTSPSLVLCFGISTILSLRFGSSLKTSEEKKLSSKLNLNLDIDKLQVAPDVKEQIKLLRTLADRNMVFHLRQTIVSCITLPLSILVMGWIFKQFL